MATIDLANLPVEVVESSRGELLETLDDECWRALRVSGQEYMDGLREGREIDDPAADRLRVLAQALIDTE